MGFNIFNENLFLILIGLIWIIGAVLQDLKRREVDNLWNFSLIGIALSYRFFVSIFTDNYWFILNGLIGLVIFFVLENIFYYSRLFAGGDAKLLFALGAILPLSFDWIVNLKIFGYFILLFFVAGSIYGLLYSFVLVSRNRENFKKEFLKQWNSYKNLFYISLILVLIWTVLVLYIGNYLFVLIGAVILIFPILFSFAKAVEESCMVKLTSSDKVTVGDWLYKDIVINGKKIKANWNGVSKKELDLIRESKKKILIKIGIPFTPSFLLGYLLLIFFNWKFDFF